MVFDAIKRFFSKNEQPSDQSAQSNSNGLQTPGQSSGNTSSQPSTASETRLDAYAAVRNKWIQLLESFVAVWAEHKPKMQVIEDLKSKNIAIKMDSQTLDGQASTMLEIDNLLIFNGIGNHMTTAKLLAVSNAVDYLLDLRDLISNFKKAFYLSKYNKEEIVNTLRVKNFKMVQLSESAVGNDSYTKSITITNMAFFTETSASEEAAFKSVAFQMCEYLRKIAQIGSSEMMNIFFNKEVPAYLQSNSIRGNAEQTAAKQVQSTANQRGTSATDSSVSLSNHSAQVTTSPRNQETVSFAQSEMTSDLIDKWIQLIDNFTTLNSMNKSKWQVRHELQGKGHRIFIRSFTAAALEETTHYATVEVENMMRLTEKGKDDIDAKNMALGYLMRFLKNLINFVRDFKYAYSPTKSASDVVDSLLLRKYEMVKLVQEQSGDGQWSTTIEIINIAWFKAVANDQQTAKNAASRKVVDMLKKMCRVEDSSMQMSQINGSSIGAASAGTTIKLATKLPLVKTQPKPENAASIEPNNKPSTSTEVTEPTESNSATSYAVKENHSVSFEALNLLINRFNRVNTADKKKFQIMNDLKSDGQPMYFSRTSLPAPDGNNRQFFVTTIVDIKNIIRFETTVEEIVARKPDALSKAFRFLNNLSNLLKDFKLSLTPSKCVVDLLHMLRIRNQETIDISVTTTSEPCTTTLKIANLITFTGQHENMQMCKHNVAAQVVKYLAKLANLAEFNVPIDQCKCFQSKHSNAPGVSKTANGQNQSKHHSKTKFLNKGQTKSANKPKWPQQKGAAQNQQTAPAKEAKNYNFSNTSVPNTKAAANKLNMDPKQSKPSISAASTQTPPSPPKLWLQPAVTEVETVNPNALTESEMKVHQQLPNIIQLIDRFNSAKGLDAEWNILNSMESNGEKIRTSLEFTGANEERIYTLTVDIENLAAFSASSKDATVCSNEAIQKAITFLGDLLDLVDNFKSLYSASMKPADLLKSLKKSLRNRRIVKMSPIAVTGKQYSCTTEIAHLATFVGRGEKANLAEEAAALKAVNYLLELTQIKP